MFKKLILLYSKGCFMAKLISILLLIAFSVSQLNGCSVIGLSMGASSDHENAQKVTTIPNSKVEKIKLGSHIILKLNNGEVMDGTYCGLDRTAPPSAIYLGKPAIGLKGIVDTTRIEMNRISEIQGTLKTNKKLTWFLIGAGLDIVLMGSAYAMLMWGGE
jgi:hypothetical protein